jgi:hypothetical protein
MSPLSVREALRSLLDAVSRSYLHSLAAAPVANEWRRHNYGPLDHCHSVKVCER